MTTTLRLAPRESLRRFASTLLAATFSAALATAAFAADPVTLRVGDQKGGNRSLLEISGFAKDLPYKIQWSDFPRPHRSSKL